MIKDQYKNFPGNLQVGGHSGDNHNFVYIHAYYTQIRSKEKAKMIAKGLEDAAKYIRKMIRYEKELK